MHYSNRTIISSHEVIKVIVHYVSGIELKTVGKFPAACSVILMNYMGTQVCISVIGTFYLLYFLI
jgi:hypothetical protein